MNPSWSLVHKRIQELILFHQTITFRKQINRLIKMKSGELGRPVFGVLADILWRPIFIDYYLIFKKKGSKPTNTNQFQANGKQKKTTTLTDKDCEHPEGKLSNLVVNFCTGISYINSTSPSNSLYKVLFIKEYLLPTLPKAKGTQEWDISQFCYKSLIPHLLKQEFRCRVWCRCGAPAPSVIVVCEGQQWTHGNCSLLIDEEAYL